LSVFPFSLLFTYLCLIISVSILDLVHVSLHLGSVTFLRIDVSILACYSKHLS
jgi:hypothetical protein